MIRNSSTKFLLFEIQTHDKEIQLRFDNGDLWLTQKSISELYGCSINNFSFHLKTTYKLYKLVSFYFI